MSSTDSTPNSNSGFEKELKGLVVGGHSEPARKPISSQATGGRPVQSTGLQDSSMHVQVVESDSISDVTVTDQIVRHRNPISSVLVSFIFHTFLLLLLALVVARLTPEPAPSILAVISEAPMPEVADDQLDTVKVTLEDPDFSPISDRADDVSVDDVLEAAAEEDVSVAEPAESKSSANEQAVVDSATVLSAARGGGLKGRSPQNRARLAAKNGATAASEAAVEKGLRWLANHQDQSTGSWQLNLKKCMSCGGDCRNSGTIESQNAATGLALLAFLGAGYTHQSGQYQGNVSHGLAYLKSRIRETRFGGSLVDDSMYAHGIATIALCEAYAMSGDESLREPIELAIQFIVSAQHQRGGWRYRPGSPGDMTVTGWQLMALKSAQMAGVEVPAETLKKASAFLDSLEDSDGAYYRYQRPKKKEPTPTAIGLLMRMYLGWPRDKGALDQGADWLLSRGVSKTDLYFNYYATQVLHHLSVSGWSEWNTELRDYLVQTQSDVGHEEGSWHFVDEHGSVGGRVYSTAMAIMVLEVYYRYLPLYDNEAVD